MGYPISQLGSQPNSEDYMLGLRLGGCLLQKYYGTHSASNAISVSIQTTHVGPKPKNSPESLI